MDNSFDLSKKTAIVTGGGSGLGKVMAMGLAGAGADVVVADIRYENALEVAKSIGRLGRRSLPLKVDVVNPVQVREMVETCVDQFGKIDILVNSAGVTVLGVPLIDMSEADWDKIVDTNLKGTFLCNQAVARQMILQKQGRIINIASMSSTIVPRNPYGSSGVYCASKAGVVLLTKAFAVDLAEYSITVNAISPGYMRTPLVADFWESDPGALHDKMAVTPMGRPGEPEELVGLVIYLASDSSTYMTGSNILIDGGYTCW